MRPLFFDRLGHPIDLETWGKTRHDQMRVAETSLPDGTWISTVWLGLDHGWGQGAPMIFETMVFASREELNERDCRRYATEAEAIAGHAAMVTKWRNGGIA